MFYETCFGTAIRNIPKFNKLIFDNFSTFNCIKNNKIGRFFTGNQPTTMATKNQKQARQADSACNPSTLGGWAGGGDGLFLLFIYVYTVAKMI